VDGLAMSSRNGYLNHVERAEAVQLYLTLCQMREAFKANQSIASLEHEAMSHLKARGWEPDYLTIRRASNLSGVEVHPKSNIAVSNRGVWVALAAARIGKTRLIDNLEFSID